MDFMAAALYLALNVYHEARGEDQMAQVAVAHVTINRARDRQLTIKETVFQPFQFSWTMKSRKSWFPKDLAAFKECFQSAYIAAQGVDFTNGATYYHHRRIKPSWAAEYAYVGDWGAHRFYKGN